METEPGVVSRSLEIAGSPFSIRIDPSPLRERLLRLLQNFPVVPEAPGTPRIAVVDLGPHFHLTVHNAAGTPVMDELFVGSDLETWFKGRIACAVFRLMGRRVIGLHGCAFVQGGSAYLVLGPRGSGKTTLTLLACEQKARYLSDDLILIDAATYRILPFPILLSVKPSGPDAHRWLTPKALAGATAGLGSLIFPRFNAQSPSALRSLSPAAALLKILGNFRNAPVFGPAAIDHAALLARQMPAVELVSCSRSSAAALLADLLPRLERP